MSRRKPNISRPDAGSAAARADWRAARYDFLEGPLGDVILRPWFDRLSLWGISRWFFPLSRAWAAALAAGRDAPAWLAAVGDRPRPPLLDRALSASMAADGRYRAANAAWEAAFFDAAAGVDLAAADRRRRYAAEGTMLARRYFLAHHLMRPFPPIRLDVATPAEVARRHGARLNDTARAWPEPALVPAVESAAYDGPAWRTSFLRFPSPVKGDAVTARVRTPAGGAPTLIMLHGLAIESEFWSSLVDPLAGAIEAGIRVIEPEGPWHGRRRLDGWYGGEPVVGRGPRGMIELFQAWVAELATLVRFARETSAGPVAIGGVSLGALTAQLYAAVAVDWPAALRPDALLLVATTGALDQIAERGSLVRALGLPPVLKSKGWDTGAIERWLPLIAPGPAVAVAPGRIVMVLGSRDDLTPYAGGEALARRWRVPAGNVFRFPRGHFSVSVGLMRDRAPLRRFLEVLRRTP